jgi:predicted dehydrogenase
VIRLAIAGGTDATHGYAFTGILNGYDPKRWASAGFREYGNRTITHARVVKVWDKDRRKAESLAELCSIDDVADDPAELLVGVDAVIIPDDLTLRHQRLARPFLRVGLPTFVDKPLADTVEEATEIVDLARSAGAPLMSCSALRYARELAETDLQRLGPIAAATVAVQGEFDVYAVHGVELAQAVLGPGVEHVQDVGRDGSHVIKLGYRDGRSVVLLAFREMAYVLQLNAYGRDGWTQITTRDAPAFYRNTLRRFLQMVEDRQPPIPYEHTLEIVRILAGARKSLAEGGVPVALQH